MAVPTSLSSTSQSSAAGGTSSNLFGSFDYKTGPAWYVWAGLAVAAYVVLRK